MKSATPQGFSAAFALGALIVSHALILSSSSSQAEDAKPSGDGKQPPSVAANAAPKKLYSGEPLQALLITGGCCHNYLFQAMALTKGVEAQADIEFTVVNDGGTGTEAMIDLYNDPDWAKPYDVVIHNECFANTSDPEYIRKITRAHAAGVPAVVVHCAMHTYRAAEIDDWREFLGVTSRKHEHQSNYPVRVIAARHPAMQGFPDDWITPKDELYIIEKLWPHARALATSVSEKTGDAHPVVWTNEFRGTRVFGTTYGHSDDTFRDPVFINLLARGIVWAAGEMEEEEAERKEIQ